MHWKGNPLPSGLQALISRSSMLTFRTFRIRSMTSDRQIPLLLNGRLRNVVQSLDWYFTSWFTFIFFKSDLTPFAHFVRLSRQLPTFLYMSRQEYPSNAFFPSNLPYLAGSSLKLFNMFIRAVRLTICFRWHSRKQLIESRFWSQYLYCDLRPTESLMKKFVLSFLLRLELQPGHFFQSQLWFFLPFTTFIHSNCSFLKLVFNTVKESRRRKKQPINCFLSQWARICNSNVCIGQVNKTEIVNKKLCSGFNACSIGAITVTRRYGRQV